MVDELIDLEPSCKWALAAAVFLASQLPSADARAAAQERTTAGAGGAATSVSERLAALQQVDPMRARYYADLAGRGEATSTTTASIT